MVKGRRGYTTIGLPGQRSGLNELSSVGILFRHNRDIHFGQTSQSGVETKSYGLSYWSQQKGCAVYVKDKWAVRTLTQARTCPRPYLLVELRPWRRVLNHSVNHEDERLILLPLAEHQGERGHSGVITQQYMLQSDGFTAVK